jgi:nitrogen PTS system EIIA component
MLFAMEFDTLHLNHSQVILDLLATSKKNAFEKIAMIAARHTELEQQNICEVVSTREKLGTTAIGNGVAIPHGKFANLEQIFGLFVRLAEPIDFESLDNQPVDLVFLLLTPEFEISNHLKVLARISRLFRDQRFCDRLRCAQDPLMIYPLLTQTITKHAA